MVKPGSIIVIVGFNRQGLTLAQLFTEAGFDVRSFVLRNELFHKEFFYTRSAKRHTPLIYENSNQFAAELEKIQKEQSGKLKVIITSSEVVSDLPIERPDLWERYDMIANPCEAVIQLSNKLFLNTTLAQLGFSMPRFCLLSDYRPNHGMLSFPVILKRNVEKTVVYDYKFKRFESENALLAFCDNVPESIRPLLFLQEEIVNSAIDLDFRGYVHKGNIIASAIVKEVRTYPTGIPSYIEEISDPMVIKRVSEPVEAILKSVDYTGFVGVDVKYDSVSGCVYVLDVNSRPPISVSSWLYKYNKEQRIAFAQTIDDPVMMPSNVYVSWVNVVRDFKALQVHSFKGFNPFKIISAKKDLKYPMRGERRIFFLNIIFTLLRTFSHKHKES